MAEYTSIPDYTMESLQAYIDSGRPTGDFLFRVLSNDLFGAVAHADDANMAALTEIVRWIYNDAPAACHGSEELVSLWISRRGLTGDLAGRRVCTCAEQGQPGCDVHA